MRSSGMASTRLILLPLPILSGCATTTFDVAQVRELAPGTYKVGVVGVGSSVLFGGQKRLTPP
jgi:hypothetical protein